jgi:hypothetical protein
MIAEKTAWRQARRIYRTQSDSNPYTGYGDIETEELWSVWNVTNPSDEYSVCGNLTKEQAKVIAQELTDDPQQTYTHPETKRTQNGLFEARKEHHSIQSQTPRNGESFHSQRITEHKSNQVDHPPIQKIDYADQQDRLL